MTDLGRYPTWILFLAAVASTVGVIARYMVLDRGANPRRTWLWLLAAWLVVVGLAGAGLLVARNGQRITPNEGLLVFADLMAGWLVLSIPVGRATRRLTDRELRQLRVGDAGATLLGQRHFITLAVVLVLGTMSALLVGELALAARLPAPPAVVACQDYTTWILAPANATFPPPADQQVLARATAVAPPGRLRQDLSALGADVQSALVGADTAQGVQDMANIPSEEETVNLDCQSVPPG